MIDTLDTQTQSLPLDQPKRRGRPATGQALSNAERQRLYRERQKKQRNEIERELQNAEATLRCDQAYNENRQEEIDAAVTAMNEAIGARNFWEKEANHHRARAEALEQRIWEAERELAQRNKKSNKSNVTNIPYHAQIWMPGKRKWETIGSDDPKNEPFYDWAEAEEFVRRMLKTGSKERYRIIPANLPIKEYK